jgi:hypothetical protein
MLCTAPLRQYALHRTLLHGEDADQDEREADRERCTELLPVCRCVC